MTASSHPTGPRPAGRWGLLAYVAGWLAIGAIAAAGVLALLHDQEDEVALPPVQQTELAVAADGADCRLRRDGSAATGEPPVAGVGGRPLAGGSYGDEQDPARLVGALRHGVVVIYYRPGIGDEHLEQLEDLQDSVPKGTIVVPLEDMRYEIAATAWDRLLGCEQAGGETADAVRLFHGRYVGQGPDTPR